jgi:hypothetical protein
VKEEDRIWLLVARKLAGEASEDEIQELADLLTSHPETHFRLESFFKLWNAVPVKKGPEDNVNKLLARIRRNDRYSLAASEGKTGYHFLKRIL